jgi:hypothetical protein
MNRRELMHRGSLVLAGAAILPWLAGCPASQSQIAELVAEMSTALNGILPYLKSVSASEAATIQQLFQALETDVKGWKAGDSIAAIEQVVNDFVASMNLIPVTADYQPLVALLVATAEGIITLVTPTTSLSAKISKSSAAPKTASTFRAAWNKETKANPRLTGLSI